MMRFLCHCVPATAASLLLAACSMSHGMGDGDSGPPDAGPPPGDSAPPPPDSTPVPPPPPPPDAGPGCSPRDVTLTCFSHVTAGTRQTVQVAIGGEGECHCGEEIACDARIGSEPRTLELSTSFCVGGALCDGCFPFVEGTCELPALEEGTWRVSVNGAYAYDLDVAGADILPERGRTCIRGSARDDDCGGVIPDPIEDRHGMVCHPDAARPGERVPVHVTDGCGGCGMLAGPCRVDVFDDVVRVRPSTVSSMCDYDCPAVCTPREDVCWTPPLEPGTWRVLVDGIDGYESRVEVLGDTPVEPGEVCGPVVAHD